MHNWNEAIRIALKISPMIIIVAALILIDPIGVILTVGIFLGIIFFIIVIAMLVKLFWYIEDKYFE